ncbi:hypothetical protein [Amycolatopsis sp. DSM 110486]|uniref:hypothetical protein n=1 Tax=Amycolatopsis sp. DSM 110486 TaxID=2865832 RepID=UPI001C699BCB|nr:hypothetical protein [Amycolatopsis sp. DSM 110486]QYN18922.1 hypothetical protein K1T34_40540 [Amycolatopsis sp. DSM 110486]
MMELGHWFPYIPPHTGPLREMERSKAREVSDDMIAMRDDRIGELTRLLEYNGIKITLDETGVRLAAEWIKREVEEDPSNLGEPRPYWAAITFDLYIFMNEVLRSINPGLKWGFYTGRKTSLVYQHPVLINLMRTKQGGPLEYFVFLQGFTRAHAAGIGYREELIWYAFQRARELIDQ